MELEIYEAFKSAGVGDDRARAAAESVVKEIDRRYEIHARQLATKADVAAVKTDIAELRADLLKAIADMQRWTMGAIFTGMTVVAALIKLL
ncbi:MAG: hypothetical protein LBE33_05745 [Zoogloeaceae bacterium]|jgi:hypothetical protein|nr:hypothetical protein [Zoogloeaceae bacterium]